MYELLHRAPTDAGNHDLQKFTRWALAYGRSTSALDGPHLFELDAARADLSGARLLGVHAIDCRFLTAMPHARFEDSFIDACEHDSIVAGMLAIARREGRHGQPCRPRGTGSRV